MSDLYLRFDNVFFEKTRLTIVTLLYREGRLSFNALKEALGATDGAAYSHLEKLKAAGYVSRCKELVDGAVASQYELTDAGKSAFQDYIAFLESMLKDHTPDQTKE
jgi:DNA-binding MarR family transcriptional regulator